MSQQAAKRRRRQFTIGFSNVAPSNRKYGRRVPNSVTTPGGKKK